MELRELGEQGLLKILQSYCPREVIGDDGAILPVPADRDLVVTTDVLVDGVHFSDATTSPEDTGFRAAAANLSDLASMGATPLGITVGLSLPQNTPIDWIKRLYDGLNACLATFQTPIVGGDICRSTVRMVAITAFGTVKGDRAIRRQNAQVGDVLLITGYHGLSRAGLELLLHPEFGQTLDPDDHQRLILAHQRPNPRLDLLPILSHIPRIAGMDSSDGLADAIVQICRSSGVGAKIERSQIPLSPALLNLVPEDQALEWALYGGEDFELVLALPPNSAQALVSQLKEGAAIIGEIVSPPEVCLIDSTGKHPTQRLTLEQGFQHFSS